MNPRFLEIRGGTGVGKSTLVRQVMKELVTVRAQDPWVGSFTAASRVKIAVPGSYRMATGGLENRYTLEECIALLHHAGEMADAVLFEGGMLSKTTGEVFDWLVKQPGGYSIIYLKPPPKITYANLRQRRGKVMLSAKELATVDKDADTVDRACLRAMNEHKITVMICTSYSIAYRETMKALQGVKR